MSANSASAPVTASTTPPRVRNAAFASAITSSTIQCGDSERITPGVCARERSPKAAAATNQSSITGPKMPPMRAVPKRWARKRPKSTVRVIGTTSAVSRGVTVSSPSTADKTEMAGVIRLSPRNIAAPMTASTVAADRSRIDGRARRRSASNASNPPSPSLSKRSRMPTYRTVTTSVIAPITIDVVP